MIEDPNLKAQANALLERNDPAPEMETTTESEEEPFVVGYPQSGARPESTSWPLHGQRWRNHRCLAASQLPAGCRRPCCLSFERGVGQYTPTEPRRALMPRWASVRHS